MVFGVTSCRDQKKIAGSNIKLRTPGWRVTQGTVEWVKCIVLLIHRLGWWPRHPQVDVLLTWSRLVVRQLSTHELNVYFSLSTGWPLSRHSEIPWHFQVFQTSGHPVSTLCNGHSVHLRQADINLKQLLKTLSFVCWDCSILRLPVELHLPSYTTSSLTHCWACSQPTAWLSNMEKARPRQLHCRLFWASTQIPGLENNISRLLKTKMQVMRTPNS